MGSTREVGGVLGHWGGAVPGSPWLCPGAEVLVGLKKARGFSFSVQKREVRTTEDQGCDEQKGERASSSIFNFPIWAGGRNLCPKRLPGNLRRMQKV